MHEGYLGIPKVVDILIQNFKATVYAMFRID